jgi:hypothetical protein
MGCGRRQIWGWAGWPPLLMACAGPSLALAQTDYGEDVRVALERIETERGELLERKGVDCGEVSSSFQAGPTSSGDDAGHLERLTRRLAGRPPSHRARKRGRIGGLGQALARRASSPAAPARRGGARAGHSKGSSYVPPRSAIRRPWRASSAQTDGG